MSAPVLAAGGLVVRPTADGPEVVLIHRPRYDDWSFPKGKVDPGERLEQTALREVFEETALRCALGDYLGRVTYLDERDTPKHIHYWWMTVVTYREFLPNAEVDACRWVTFAQARQMLSRAADRDLLQTPATAPGSPPPAGDGGATDAADAIGTHRHLAP